MRIPNRKRANSRGAKKYYTKHAMKVHKKNLPSNPMRGGIRL